MYNETIPNERGIFFDSLNPTLASSVKKSFPEGNAETESGK